MPHITLTDKDDKHQEINENESEKRQWYRLQIREKRHRQNLRAAKIQTKYEREQSMYLSSEHNFEPFHLPSSPL